ncbi:MAG: polyprenyl synthetase family protein [Bacteroidaceae bacterium]|nr:polyprenyl synthetase family protein [Bacteroidaceae bacterium]
MAASPTPLEIISKPVHDELQTYRELFDSTLTHPEALLSETLAYIKQRQGKMMRPMLVLLMAREAGGVNQKALLAAVALEMLHTASLVHDDVVDESALRRGMASVNQQYGNKVAVLLGDYLLSLLLCKAAETGDSRIVERIARLGGTLSEGEIFQLSTAREQMADEEAYFRIIRRKTAALFAACGEIGALAAGGDDALAQQARIYGECVGVCFQIRDDIFDFYADKNIGKPTGNDLLEGKFTLPAIYALRTAPSPTLLPLIERVKRCEATPDDVQTLVEYTKAHGGIDYALGVMDEYRLKAHAALAGFRDAAVRDALTAYADYVAAREF